MGLGVGGRQFEDARGDDGGKDDGKGLTMGLGASQGAMEMVWSDLGVVARTLGREGTKNVELYLTFNQSCTTLGHQLNNISPTNVRSRPFLEPISRPHPLWRPRMPRGCLGRPRTGSGVGGIPIWDARDAGVQRAARAGHIMGLGTAQGAMQTLWRVVGVVARALGRQGTKTFGLDLKFVTWYQKVMTLC